MTSRLRYHSHGGEGDVKPGCEDCKKKFEQTVAVCAFCCHDVSNKVYFASDYHQNGKCKARAFNRATPERTVDKPLPYPMPALDSQYKLDAVTVQKLDPKYPNGPHDHVTVYWPTTPAELAKWWSVPLIGQEKMRARRKR